ncbi:MAG: outer membrane beta-barrel protein [Draconibacterium sp.]
MKKKFLLVVFVLFTVCSVNSYAQFNPYTEGNGLLSVGVGASGWGIPVFVRYEHPVADNITVGGAFSYQSKSESYVGYKWKHTISGLNARASYHLNELLNVPNEWDFYGGASLGYYIWNTKYNGTGTSFDYTGSGSGGFSLGGHIGARYFVKENIGVVLELGGGTVLAGGTIGVTFLL